MAVDLAATPAQPKIEDLTFVDLTGLAFAKASAYQGEETHPGANREFALAKTALEEAVMRFNRGRSILLGTFHVADTEDPAYLAAVAEMKAENEETGNTTTEGA